MNDHPYSDFLTRVRKPSRYIGGEYGQTDKRWQDALLRVALAYPDLYELGMSHLGLRILYDEVNRRPELLAERVFAPDLDLEQELRERRLPLVSLESWHPLAEFDVVGFSLQYELTYTNLLNMLDLGGIPLHSAERGEADPLVIAGGPCALHPEPLAPFVDLFVIGEAEEALPALLGAILAGRRAGRPRAELLAELAARPGCYVPQCYEVGPAADGCQVVTGPKLEGLPARVRRVWVQELDRFPFPALSPVSSTETTFDRLSLEISRGCTQGCRFCQAGMSYRPLRERAPQAVLDTALEALRATGHDEVSLTSLSTADYSALASLVPKLAEQAHRRKASMSVSSLRAYGLDEALLREIGRVRTTGLTFAPEAGTQRLRDVINKNISEDDLASAAEVAFRLGWSRIKLYFMLGLPTETDEDLLAILDATARIRGIGRRHRGRGAEVTASVSTFVPRPHTPFQWAAMDSEQEVLRKQSLLHEEARRRRLPFKKHDTRASRLEGVFARGDRRLADVIEAAWRAGARFDGWDERLDEQAWSGAFEAADLQPETYLAARQPGERLPWDHIDPGPSPQFLAREWRRALRGQPTTPCLVPRRQQEADAATDGELDAALVCHACGVGCNLELLAGLRAVERDRQAQPVTAGGVATAGAAPAAQDQEPAVPQEAEAAPSTQEEQPRLTRQMHGRGGRRGGSRAPAPAFEQGRGARYRVHYAKLDRATLLGHLDLVRDLPRIVRRAGLMPRYSQGYHPKPQMTFGPALRLGVASTGEWLDLQLDDELPAEELVVRLNEVATGGIRFLRAVALEQSAGRLSRQISVLEYGLLLREEAAERLAGASWREGWRSGGGAADRDGLPDEVIALRLDPSRVAPAELALPPGGPLLRMLLPIRQGALPKVVKVAEALGISEGEILAEVRLGCWGMKEGDSLSDPLRGEEAEKWPEYWPSYRI